MKTFNRVKMEMDEVFQDCLMLTKDFLDCWEKGSITSYDGVGDIHNGQEFITDGFETDIFEFIRSKAFYMTKEEFIEQYPYIAWYNN